MTTAAVEIEEPTPSVVAVGRGRTWLVWSARGGVRLVWRGVPATARALKGASRASGLTRGRLLPMIVLVLAVSVIAVGLVRHRRRRRG